MRTLKLICGLILSISIFSCSSDDTEQLPEVSNAITSQFCPEITNFTAIYWDNANGQPITGITSIPTIANPGTQFIHSQLPLLGFTLPQGYAATEVLDPITQTIGVNVIRTGNTARWRYIPTTTLQGRVPIQDIMAFEINRMLEFHNFLNQAPTVVCTRTPPPIMNEASIETSFSARLVDFENFRGLVWANAHYIESLDLTFISASASSGPRAEYDSLIEEVFLPINFQLLFIDNDVRDSDLDGVPDAQDSEPFNPAVQ